MHGGPGGTLGSGGYRDHFDLTRYRVVGLDQRGCGASTPLACDPRHDLGANTTAQLIEDIEALRDYLGIGAWVLNGVSWGSTLALAYAQAHPDRVLGIVLVAVTTTSRAEVDWITEGCGILYPEAWEDLTAELSDLDPNFARGRTRVIDSVAALMRSSDAIARVRAARAWTRWEDHHVAIGAGGYRPNPRWSDPVYAENFATLVSHYWSHDGFSSPPLAAGMGAIADIPGHLIHGRLDVSGPATTAWAVHRAWPASVLTIVEGEGHGGETMMRAWQDANHALLETIPTAG